ncbi:MAG TPA: glycosyltransferase family 39 protein [Longimicrobiales bacterium]
MSGTNALRKAEVLLVVLLMVFGLAMRVWRMSGVTLDHFDEGVYAFSALGVSDPQQPRVMYPSQEIFSPPLYFGLAGVLSRALDVTPDHALLALSILFGTLTIAAVWWLGRAGFGSAAGLSAAAIIAFNPFHIAFSRSALTDITFTFWLLCALGALVAAIERGSFRWAVLAGLATGLAWNTKYHGWFALLITGAALVPFTWRRYRERGMWQRPIAVWTVAAITAFLCYLPWMIYLRTRPGGYGGMARHYLGMLRTEWAHNFVRYGEMLAYFEGPASRIAMALAIGAAVLYAAPRQVSARRLLALLAVLGVVSLALGSAGTTLLLSLAAVPLLLKRPVPFRVWVLLAWIGLWIVAAPVYRPYARLLLPFTVATAIGAGIGLALAADWLRQPGEVPARRLQWAWLGVFLVAMILVSFSIPTTARPWPHERGMAAVADSMTHYIPLGSRVIAVIEPTPAYYLHRAGRPGFERNGGFAVFDTLSTSAYVITGTYVRQSPRLQKRFAGLSAHFTAVGVFKVRPYDVRILDDLSPAAARRYRAHPDSTFDLHLWRFTP